MRIRWLCVAAFVGSTSLWAVASQADEKQGREAEIQQRVVVIDLEEGREHTANKYWLGIQTAPLSDALKAQLDLESGVLIEDVMKDGPAAKAGVKQYDVLLKVGDHSVGDLDSLMAAVGKFDGKSTSVVVLRKATQKTIEVRPEKRPPHIRVKARTSFPKELLEGLGVEGFPRKLLFLGPGFEIRDDEPNFAGQLQIDSITITKQNDGPAAITVKRGDKKWEVTEDSLDSLPADLAATIKRMLLKSRVGEIFRPPLGGPQFRVRPRVRVEAEAEDDKASSTQMKQILRQIEQLRKELEGIKAQLSDDEEGADPPKNKSKTKRQRKAAPIDA